MGRPAIELNCYALNFKNMEIEAGE